MTLAALWHQVDFDKPARLAVGGAPAGHDARVLASLAQAAGRRGLVHIASDDLRAANLKDLLAFLAPGLKIITLPAWDCLPYDRVSPSGDIVAERMTALRDLANPSAASFLLLTTVAALMQRLPPLDILKQAEFNLSKGDVLSRDALQLFFDINGYCRTDVVREAGEYAIRGSIIDLFPSTAPHAIRLDLFGDEIETVRSFDPLTQLTIGDVQNIQLGSMAEVFLDDASVQRFRTGYRDLFGAITDSDPLYAAVTARRRFPGIEHWAPLFHMKQTDLLACAPDAAVSLDWQVEEAMKARWSQIEEFYQARLTLLQAQKGKHKQQTGAVYRPLPPDSLYLKPDELMKELAGRTVLDISPMPAANTALNAGGTKGLDFAEARARQDHELLTVVRDYAVKQPRSLVVAYSNGARDRLMVMARDKGWLDMVAVDSFGAAEKLPKQKTPVAILGLEHGFISPDLTVITEQDIFGDRITRAVKKKKVSDQFRLELGSLNIGDLVVHEDHGIGRYEGLETLSVAGAAHDCLRVVYAGGDKLFVPVENLDILSRYGADEGQQLDKLGGVGWQSRKSRIKKRLKDMADQLIKVAAERALKTGERIDVPSGLYDEFAARFPYAETEDQAKAIDDVMTDLGSGKPMDRLVCGDVGFGKTEIALRAAFLAVQAGLQVAVVVPTTLLARQHYQNFSRRFHGMPVRIEQLSRFVSVAEAGRTKDQIKAGQVDIVIGTHALLAKDMAFKRLGLLIVDEEQHFGVKQKEQLKELCADVHVLTLTATPIPRTLQLALAGVRELSLITTPPIDRLAVRSFVLPYDPMVIREAIMREHFRGGQTFYVCPRIEDLDEVAGQLRDLVPEIKSVMAHGRLPAAQLDDVMSAFDAGQYDLLLSTNIVESGLDIPNANTIILHRADMFGLSQLYQLRGRVGRGKQRAYAYLTYQPDTLLTESAKRRLEVIATLDQLGAGFQLASHDMDIRGSGNLLGEEQSGHMKEVGIELYQQMLEDAVAAAREAGAGGAGGTDKFSPQINLGISVLIPDTYVMDLNVRLGLYRRAAELSSDAEVESFAAELVDRFGPLPMEVDNLLQVMRVKQMCLQANIAKIDVGPKGAIIAFHNNQCARPDLLIQWLQKQGGSAKLRPDQKLVLVRAWDDIGKRLLGLKAALHELVSLATG